MKAHQSKWILAVSGAVLIAACASAPRRPVAAVTGAVGAASGVELPPGPGRTILQNSCTACHALTEVTKFRGYYNKPRWQDIVNTMMEYGAKITKDEGGVLADYLTEHLGPK